MPTVHIINHTHWDREWFLTEEYTSAWIPALIDSLEKLVEVNADYRYLFDGQTLVIEDLLRTRQEYRDRVSELMTKGNLTIGPLYSQPDWRMVSGESHMRNLAYGVGDAESLGGTADVAWLVDTFGHISQAPQMLSYAGIDAAYVWRGVPAMTPLFSWEGADGTRLATIDLFGGYRNLYGITHTEEIAVERLHAEVAKLAGSYGEIPIPLFDGYDLDVNPEDPARYYDGCEIDEGIELVASSPRTYADAVRPHVADAPTIRGELISGKFGSTFPGTLSSRAYLTVAHHDAESLMHRRIEPLAALAEAAGRMSYDGETYERLSRELLQNGVHDCICGVSIDQVHERMERSYKRILGFVAQRQDELASALLQGFAPGTYAISASAMASAGSLRVDGGVVRVDAKGVGVSEVAAEFDVAAVGESFDTYSYTNSFFSATLDKSGLSIDGRPALRIVVLQDDGDTYSSEPGEPLGEFAVTGEMTLLDRSDLDERAQFTMSWSNSDIDAQAVVTVRFSESALLELSIELDSTGTGFRIDAEIHTGITTDTVHASMPFDIVERPHEDTDLLGHDIDPALAGILMGQRESGRVTEFPFHDFVALSSGERTGAVLAKGLRSYSSTSAGTIRVTLRRSAEWLALTDLQLRAGDAGPMMYVPLARCERVVTHELAIASLPGDLQSCGLVELSEWFHNPPVVATVESSSLDGPTEWLAFAAGLPMTNLSCTTSGDAIARLWNPWDRTVQLAEPLSLRAMRGDDIGTVSNVEPRKIVSAAIEIADLPESSTRGSVDLRTPVPNRVQANRSMPDAGILALLDARIEESSSDLAFSIDEVRSAEGTHRWLATHRQYVIERELLELKLSRELNERLAHSAGEVSIPDERDPVIASLGEELNDLRVKRRIFDYVAQALTMNAK